MNDPPGGGSGGSANGSRCAWLGARRGEGREAAIGRKAGWSSAMGWQRAGGAGSARPHRAAPSAVRAREAPCEDRSSTASIEVARIETAGVQIARVEAENVGH